MGRSLLGIGLVALGLIILGDQIDWWDGNAIVRDWWPVAVIAAGLAQLTQRPRPWMGAGIIVAIGIVLLLAGLDVLGDDAWALIVPSALVCLGIWLILTHLTGERVRATTEDRVHLLAVMGRAKSASRAAAFAGGRVTALFGGANLDLRQATPVPGGARLTASAIFGDAEIVVPRGWDIRVSGVPIFGGIDDKTRDDGLTSPDAPRLAINAVALFGGVEVKHAE